MEFTDEDRARFKEKIKVRHNGCHEWQGVLGDAGYGQFFMTDGTYSGTGNIQAHRVAYMMATGEDLKTEEQICHRCDNRRCVNPEHLFKGDARINAYDAIHKGRHTAAKLGKEQVLALYKRYEEGASIKELAEEFDLHDRSVRNVVAGRTYKDYHEQWVEQGGGRRPMKLKGPRKQLLILIPEDDLWELKRQALDDKTTQTTLVLEALRKCYGIGNKRREEQDDECSCERPSESRISS